MCEGVEGHGTLDKSEEPHASRSVLVFALRPCVCVLYIVSICLLVCLVVAVLCSLLPCSPAPCSPAPRLPLPHHDGRGFVGIEYVRASRVYTSPAETAAPPHDQV
jgi:hypothetical protein